MFYKLKIISYQQLTKKIIDNFGFFSFLMRLFGLYGLKK